MKILFLHGLDSKPFQDRIDILSKYGSLDMPLIDYRNQPNIFNTYLEKVKETHYDVIIGHSLGGCLAFHLCNQLQNTECLLFMPSFKSNNEKLLAIPDIIDTTLVPNDLMVIVSTKDKVVNNDKTYDMIPTDDIIEVDDVEGDNGHSLSPTVLEKWFKVFIGIHENIVTNINAFRRLFEKGVSFNTDSGKYDFDFKQDRDTDIMHLQPLNKRTKMMHHEGVNYQYYYAYHFEDGSHPGFLRAIKYIDNIDETDAAQLVENAVGDLCSKYNIQEYDTMLYPKSSSKILERFANVLGEQGIISTFIPNAFVKNSVENITLDQEAVNKLPDATKKQVNKVFQHIKDMKTEFKLKDVFTRYRKFIKNFIKLDKDIIQHVEGKKVILMDDYHTTGTTSKEMLNILFGLKPTEILIIFLVKVK